MTQPTDELFTHATEIAEGRIRQARRAQAEAVRESAWSILKSLFSRQSEIILPPVGSRTVSK